MTRFSLRGNALDWWISLVNSKGRDGNLFAPPESGDQDPITLVNSIQPVFQIDPRSLDRNPAANPIVISFSAAKRHSGRTFTRVLDIPLYDLSVINSYLQQIYGVGNVGLHPLGDIVGTVANWKDDGNGAPDFDHPATDYDGFFSVGTTGIRMLGDDAGLLEITPVGTVSNQRFLAGTVNATNVPIGAQSDDAVPTLEVRSTFAGTANEWSVIRYSAVLYPSNSAPPVPAQTSASLSGVYLPT